MLARVRRTLRERRLLSGGERVLIACSGGPDSMALLDVMDRLAPELEVELGVASVDHGLRAEAADEVELVRREASRRRLGFFGLTVRVEGGASIQAAARAARYEALFELARVEGFSRIATGHHLGDQAETVLHRLLRGSGLFGLAGIDPLRPDGVIRPLIDVRREEIEAHVERFGIPSVCDPSNEDLRNTRARLRSRLLPGLREEDPRVDVHLAAIADEARALRAHLEGELTKYDPRGRTLDAAEVRSWPRALRSELLARWMHDELGIALGREHRQEALSVAERGGSQLLPGGATFAREGERLVLRASSGGAPRGRARGNHD